MATRTGVVKTAISEKSFGFISLEGIKNDIFFHVNEVQGKQMPLQGETVRFDLGTRKGKYCAKNIQIDGVCITGHERKWFTAVLEQDVETLRSIAAMGQDVNTICRERIKCQYCVGRGRPALLHCLFCNGSGLQRPMEPAVVLAVVRNKLESLKALVALGVDVNHWSIPLLSAAIVPGKEAYVETLLSARANPNCAFESGPNSGVTISWSPLQFAADINAATIAEMLLEAGANPDVRATGEVAHLISRWRPRRPLAVHVLAQATDSIKLSITNLAGVEVAQFCTPIQDVLISICDSIESLERREDGEIKVVFPNGCQYSGQELATFTETVAELLDLDGHAGHMDESQQVLGRCS